MNSPSQAKPDSPLGEGAFWNAPPKGSLSEGAGSAAAETEGVGPYGPRLWLNSHSA